MRGSVILFARAPRFGVGKTRLAKGIGRLAAWRFYRNMLVRTLRMLGSGPWRITVAVASPGDARHPTFRGCCIEVQHGQDLGERMRRALTQAPPGPAVLIGSDIPGLTQNHIRQAFAALRTADFVFGPAADGGFWLVGLSGRRSVRRDFMSDIRWSSPHALADVLAGLPEGAKTGFIQTLADVDTAEDYETYRAERRR